MFHFSSNLELVQRPNGATTTGGILYQDVNNNVQAQFLGAPREQQFFSSSGETTYGTVVFGMPPDIPIDVDWRLVFDNVGYIVNEVSPELDLEGNTIGLFVFTRKENVRDDAVSYKDTV